MTEILVNPPGGSFPDFGLEVINEQQIRLERPDPRGEPVTATGSAGNDTIRPLSLDDPTIFNIVGGEGDDNLSGGAGADTISGDGGRDTLAGGIGADLISGGLSGDEISGDAGRDRLRGNEGRDEVSGGAGSDTVRGNAGNDTLLGGGGNDKIVGVTGNDTLDGDQGRDTLIGGPGRDRFRFEQGDIARNQSQVDQINDFNSRDDTILLDQNLLTNSGLAAGNLPVNQFEVVDQISEAGTAAIIYERSTGLVYFNPESGTNIPLFRMDRNLNVTAADFEIF